MHRLMLVDDEDNILRALRRALHDRDYVIEAFTDPRDALRRAAHTDFDLVLSDYRMPGLDGVAFLTALKELRPQAIRLVLSGYADLAGMMDAINIAEIYRFLPKPWEDYELRTTIKLALAHRNLLVENARLAEEVRAQRCELQRLESAHPGITQVSWGADGSIILDGSDQ